MRTSGRTILLALLRLLSSTPDTGTPASSRLRAVVRLFLRRDALPTAPAMRLLILKVLSLSTAGTSKQGALLLTLERR